MALKIERPKKSNGIKDRITNQTKPNNSQNCYCLYHLNGESFSRTEGGFEVVFNGQTNLT